MTDSLNLPALRKIAEGATQGEWRLAEWGAVIVTNNAKIGGDVRLFDVRGWGYLTGKGHGGLGMEPEDAIAQQTADGRHVATFDPPTVLRLLDRLDMAEKSYDQIQAQELADTEADRDAWKARAEAAEASLAQAVEIMERIATGDTEVFDEDLQMNVIVSADAEELSAAADAYLKRAAQ